MNSKTFMKKKTYEKYYKIKIYDFKRFLISIPDLSWSRKRLDSVKWKRYHSRA